MKKKNKIIIGWQEWAALPDIFIPAVKVKVDTGARTSSLHAENISHFEKNGKKYLSFDVHPIQKNKEITVRCEAELVDKRHVKSSNGAKEIRPVIKTRIQIGENFREIELNLTKRDYMGCRMLLGRNAMEGIIIDPEEKFLHGKISKKESKIKYTSQKDLK